MTPRSVIVGLDVSPKRIGWAVVDYDTGHHIRHGVEHVTGDDDLRARRIAFRNVTHAAESRGDVCAVILEDAYVGVSRRGTIVHAVSVGNVEAWAAMRWPDQLVVRLAPATWRAAVGLPTRGKEAVMAWACAYVGDMTQDEADALGIATAGHILVWSSDVGLDAAAPNDEHHPDGKEA